MDDEAPPRPRLRQIRRLLWVLIALAILGTAALLLVPRAHTSAIRSGEGSAQARLAAPFTLIDGAGKPFPSSRLAGKPYAIFFGFTRCGDVCPTTLGRLAKLREQAGGEDALNIVFVTIDPANDGPKEVGQYAELFGSPIIGLTGSAERIAQVKKQYGIFAGPNPTASGHGDMISHTSSVLLFDRGGRLSGTISGGEPDAAALQKLRQLAA